MESYLNQAKYSFENIDTVLPEELNKLLTSGFRIEQECILYKDFQYFGPGELNSDFQKCEYEIFLNDIHIDDYVKNVESELEYLKLGFRFAKKLQNELKIRFTDRFRIIISFSETAYSGQEIETYGGCVVNFYKIRPSSDEKFKVANLEGFEEEAVMVIE